MKDNKEMFKKVFGESVEEALREMGEEGVGARARKVEAVPNKKEVEEQNLDHAVLRSWRPRCVKGRAEACGHKKRGDGGDAPSVSLGCYFPPEATLNQSTSRAAEQSAVIVG